MSDNRGMGDVLEEKIRDLLLAAPDLAELKSVYRGDPAFVPVELYPFAIVVMLIEGDTAGERMMETETGPVTYWKYEGMVHLEVLQPDVGAVRPDADRRSDVPSYMTTRRLLQAARAAVLDWAGPDGGIPVANRVSFGAETTLALGVGRIENGLAVQSRSDNVSNVGAFPLTVYTRKEDYLP